MKLLSNSSSSTTVRASFRRTGAIAGTQLCGGAIGRLVHPRCGCALCVRVAVWLCVQAAGCHIGHPGRANDVCRGSQHPARVSRPPWTASLQVLLAHASGTVPCGTRLSPSGSCITRTHTHILTHTHPVRCRTNDKHCMAASSFVHCGGGPPNASSCASSATTCGGVERGIVLLRGTTPWRRGSNPCGACTSCASTLRCCSRR